MAVMPESVFVEFKHDISTYYPCVATTKHPTRGEISACGATWKDAEANLVAFLRQIAAEGDTLPPNPKAISIKEIHDGTKTT